MWLEGIFVEGLIYGLLALGVFITFRILDFPDLTVDGSFPLGAAVMVKLIYAEVPPDISFCSCLCSWCTCRLLYSFNTQ